MDSGNHQEMRRWRCSSTLVVRTSSVHSPSVRARPELRDNLSTHPRRRSSRRVCHSATSAGADAHLPHQPHLPRAATAATGCHICQIYHICHTYERSSIRHRRRVHAFSGGRCAVLGYVVVRQRTYRVSRWRLSGRCGRCGRFGRCGRCARLLPEFQNAFYFTRFRSVQFRFSSKHSTQITQPK